MTVSLTKGSIGTIVERRTCCFNVYLYLICVFWGDGACVFRPYWRVIVCTRERECVCFPLFAWWLKLKLSSERKSGLFKMRKLDAHVTVHSVRQVFGRGVSPPCDVQWAFLTTDGRRGGWWGTSSCCRVTWGSLGTSTELSSSKTTIRPHPKPKPLSSRASVIERKDPLSANAKSLRNPPSQLLSVV